MDSRSRALAFLSVLPTPLLVLGPAHELYLRNQRELDGLVGVLRPFWIGAAATVAVGLLLTALRARRWARTALWAYHAAGATFLVYSLLRALPWGEHLAAWTLDRFAGVALVFLAYVAAVARLSRLDPGAALKPLAAFAVVLVAQEAWRMGSRLAPPPAIESAAQPAPALDAAGTSLPNVYHLVLDAFQPDHFELAWPKESPLDGFVHFTQTRSLYPATAPSMASLFASRRHVTPPRFLQDALTSPDALTQRLRAAGYRTVAYVPAGIYPEPLPSFDAVVWHAVRLPPEQSGALHRWLFPRLWMAVTLPADLVDRIAGARFFGLEPRDLRLMRTLRGSTLTQPVTTLLSFERYLAHEPGLPERGRYTLVHLLVPHDPFVLTADCAFSPTRTDVLTQSRCAALVLRRFLDRLDALGRLRGSVVLVHSDHGDWAGGPLDVGQPALLLLKPAGASGAPVRRSEPASLVDVTPTLLSVLGLPAGRGYDGHALLGGSNPRDVSSHTP